MSLFKDHTQEQHRKTLADFLPNGKSFESKNNQGSTTFNFLLGIASELITSEKLFNLVAEEYGIKGTTLLIEEWERAVGIPDHCFTGSETIAERRRDVIIKLAQTFDTRESFIRFGLDILGIRAINIRNGTYYSNFPLHFPWIFYPSVTFPLPFPWNFRTAKDAKFTMIVELPTELAPSVFGIMKFPFPFNSGAASLIECIFREAKPAFCDIKFLYIL